MKRRALSLALALAVCLGLTAPVLADESTTTIRTAYKDLDARTEIYTVTQTPGSDYPYHGAMHEPKGGVWYGRTTLGGTKSDGSYGLVNQGQMEGESAVSFYSGTTDAYSMAHWSYLYGPALEDGTRAFLLYYNFNQEGTDCALVTSGAYDSKLIELFDHLNGLNCPVFIRIGGEMNVWGAQTTPAEFIAAYRHIVDIGRSRAPRVAMVFSPNYSGGNRQDMDTFYPGDQYVDWIGTSLYYDRYHHSGDTARDEFYGVGVYGDAMLNVQQTVNLSRLHNKPVILTEGGSSNQFSGQDNSSWAAERMQKAYSFLPMVYPEIKCIISSDYGNDWSSVDYTFYDNSVVTSAYRQAVASSPVYVHDYRDTGAYYTKLSAYTGKWEGTMDLAAYTYSPDKLSAVWSVDGQIFATCTDYPYAASLDVSALAGGDHSLTVTFSNGASKSYAFQVTEAPVYAQDGAQVSKWAQAQVDEALAQDLVPQGLGSDYRVEITRGQFAAAAVKLYEAMSGEKAPAPSGSAFTDTTDPVILQAAELGFVNGIGGGAFAPDALVTREQAASMLSRVYTKLGGEIPAVESTSFQDDGQISGWARDAVAFMSGKRIINGWGGSFAPQGNASIEQAMIISLGMSKGLR